MLQVLMETKLQKTLDETPKDPIDQFEINSIITKNLSNIP
jgi:hypothetical protein